VKAAPYFNADGTPSQLTSEDNQRKLVQALMKYKSNAEMTEQQQDVIRKTLAAAKAKSFKTLEIAKQAAKASQSANAALSSSKKDGEETTKVTSRAKSNSIDTDVIPQHRIESVLAALRLVAERRRTLFNTKKSGEKNSNPVWEKNLAELPDALRNSLWQKMQRRRLTIVLRPTRTCVLEEAQDVVKEAISKAVGGTPAEVPSAQSATTKRKEQLKALLRSEKLLLLGMHPEAPTPLPPSVPPSSPSEPWAEPGWQVVLNVSHNADTCPHASLLPSISVGPIFQQFLSGCASAPGRQVATLLKPRHLSMLTTPLSMISGASAPAETDPLSSVIAKGKGVCRLFCARADHFYV